MPKAKAISLPSVTQLFRDLPQPPVTPRIDRVPTISRRTALPSGPKMYHLERAGTLLGGPGSPPPGFVTPTTSAVEWYWYWGMQNVKGPEGPANGWAYQDAQAGGRSMPGGSIVDFVVFDRVPRLAIRIQTERFHQTLGSRKQAEDAEQQVILENLGFEVYNTWSQDWENDKSGRAVIAAVRRALSGIHDRDPIYTGNSLARG